MDDTEVVFGRVVKEAYARILSKNCVPGAAMVCSLVNDVVERNAYDIIYSDVDFKKIDQDYIHKVLTIGGCLHSYGQQTFFDAQNMIFKDFYPKLKLIEGDCSNETKA